MDQEGLISRDKPLLKILFTWGHLPGWIRPVGLRLGTHPGLGQIPQPSHATARGQHHGGPDGVETNTGDRSGSGQPS